MMNLAALRNRLRPILRSFGTRSMPEAPEAGVPLLTPMVYRLAIVAVGDGDSAAVLAADTLAQLARRRVGGAPSPEVAAVRTLKALLPTGWLSWPGAAGPAEWLRLGLRREQADRLLSVLGEREPIERIALALHLLYDVRRDDLDAWLGTHGMGEQIVLLASYVGEGLELVPPQLERAECAAVAHDLLDIGEPQLGRQARLHSVGCDVCRERARGMRQTFGILREALLTFFRTPLPPTFGTLLRGRELQLRYPRIAWRPVAAVVAVSLLLLFMQRGARGQQATVEPPAPAPQTAAELIDRALHRLDADRPSSEVWHEQVRFAGNGEWLLLERWYEFSRAARTRITVRPESGGEPLLDVVADGRSVSYTVQLPGGAARSTVVRQVDGAAVLPLLRQLPFAGNLGDRWIDQRALDLTLLLSARQGKPRLLGSTLHDGRPAWMVVVETRDAGDMTLTLDRESSTLLEARTGDGAADTRTHLVWDMQLFEMLNRKALPLQTFGVDTDGITASALNPRQLALRAAPLIGNDDAMARALPLPTLPPDRPLFSYVRGKGRGVDGVVAVYESRWSTMQIIYPLSDASAMSRPYSSIKLTRPFDGGRYGLVEYSSPNMTLAEFALDSAPRTRLGVFYWHAFADQAEREAAIERMLNSLQQGPAARAPKQAVRLAQLRLDVENTRLMR